MAIGTRQCLEEKGTNQAVAAATAIAGADALLLQPEDPLETVTQAAQIASAHGVTVILNPAPARAVPVELLALVDLLIPNESETELLSGLPVENQLQTEAAAKALRSRGVGTVILTLGNGERCWRTRVIRSSFPPLRLPQSI